MRPEDDYNIGGHYFIRGLINAFGMTLGFLLACWAFVELLRWWLKP